MTISVFRWNSCDLSTRINGHQSQTLKTLLGKKTKMTHSYLGVEIST